MCTKSSTYNLCLGQGLCCRLEGELCADVIWSSEASGCHLVIQQYLFYTCYQNVFENLEDIRDKEKAS